MRATISETIVIHIDLSHQDFDRIRKEWRDYNKAESENEEDLIPAGISQLVEAICHGASHA